MAAANNILKNFAVSIDGKGFAGNAKEIQLPALTLAGEDFRAGGMDAPIFIEMGQEKLEASITLSSFDILALAQWGVGEGYSVPVVARGALESLDGTVQQVVVAMRGKVVSFEPSAWTPGAEATLKFSLNLTTYRYEQNGQIIHDIDVPNMKRVIGSVDRLAEQRAALGLGGSALGVLDRAADVIRSVSRARNALGGL
jgi:P2 family phage contractile tail tube protein